MQRGDIWLVDLPGEKQRPAVVVSADVLHRNPRYVIVASITSTLRDRPYTVAVGSANGVDRDSIVNTTQLNTIPVQQLVEHWGCLNAAQLQELDDALHYTLGLEG